MKVKKKIGKLIDKGCTLNKQKKEIEEELGVIKKALEELTPETYTSKEGSVLVITATESYDDIKPEKAHQELKAKRKGSHFYECMKVRLTELKKYLADDDIAGMREKKGKIRRYCFK